MKTLLAALVAVLAGCGGGDSAPVEEVLFSGSQTVQGGADGTASGYTLSPDGGAFQMPAGARVEVCSTVTWRQTVKTADRLTVQIMNAGSFSDPARGNASAQVAQGATGDLTATACHTYGGTTAGNYTAGTRAQLTTACGCLGVLSAYSVTFEWRVKRLG